MKCRLLQLCDLYGRAGSDSGDLLHRVGGGSVVIAAILALLGFVFVLHFLLETVWLDWREKWERRFEGGRW